MMQLDIVPQAWVVDGAAPQCPKLKIKSSRAFHPTAVDFVFARVFSLLMLRPDVKTVVCRMLYTMYYISCNTYSIYVYIYIHTISYIYMWILYAYMYITSPEL